MIPMTVAEIIDYAMHKLNPREAQKVCNGDYAHKCTTDIITVVKTPTSIVELNTVPCQTLKEGTGDGYAAIYVRVSTERQNHRNRKHNIPCTDIRAVTDGLSMRDQLTRGINFCIERQAAFRIYSDAELSGGEPPNNPELIKELYEMKANKYRQAIEAVFLSEYNTLRTLEEKESVRAYMRENIAEILYRSGEDDAAWERTFDIQSKNDSRLFKPRRIQAFRPALTLLLADLERTVHTLIVTDMSRLSRSTALTAKIIKTLERRRIKYVGMVENAPMFREKHFVGRIISAISAQEAEQKLYDVCMNSVRGMVALLESGRPHSTLPFWLERNADGCGVLCKSRHQSDKDITGEELGRLVIEMWLEAVSNGRGLQLVCDKLMLMGIYAPRGGKIWNVTAISEMLRNKTLIGIHSCFGLAACRRDVVSPG